MPNSATVQDMVPPLATLETRSFLFLIGHSWSRRPPHLPPPTELRSSPAAAAAAKLQRCHSLCISQRGLIFLSLQEEERWWQLDGSQEKQGKRKGAKRQGKWTMSYNDSVATDRCPLAYCSG
uniref:Uncharacterized protein n=1 Tax=Oryza nivara TaxID=4536 RepID=A0A0E0FKB8_ORYNI